MMNKSITIIGMPIHLGQDLDGVDLGPQAIRYASLVQVLRKAGYEVVDSGNIFVPARDQAVMGDPRMKYLAHIVEVNMQLASRVSEVLLEDRFPLVLGGDHSMAIGTITGIKGKYRRLGLIWIDAHGDLNTAETTPSGNIHGMPLAVSLGLGHPDLVELGGEFPKVKPEHTVIIGARDVDCGERALIRKLGINVFTYHDIERMGIASVMDKAIQIATKDTDGVHLSFDLDSLDPREVMGVGTPVPGGLTFREGQLALRMLADAGVICSAEFVEVNPLLDHENHTAKVTVDLIKTLFGENVLNSVQESEMLEAR